MYLLVDHLMLNYNRAKIVIQKGKEVDAKLSFSRNGTGNNVRILSCPHCRLTRFRRVYSLTT